MLNIYVYRWAKPEENARKTGCLFMSHSCLHEGTTVSFMKLSGRSISLLGMLERFTDRSPARTNVATNVALALNPIAKRISNLIERTHANAGPSFMNETVMPRADIIMDGRIRWRRKKRDHGAHSSQIRLSRTCLLYGALFRVHRSRYDRLRAHITQ